MTDVHISRLSSSIMAANASLPIDREHQECSAPRRKADIENAMMDCIEESSRWPAAAKSYLPTLFSMVKLMMRHQLSTRL
jgi:hypothetical protein